MSSARRFHTWQVAGQPVVVHLSFGVIDRIAEEALRGLGALPRRGAEVGGILLGSVKRDDPLAVKVVDCQPIPCGHYFGPSYVLTQEEKQTLEQALNRWRPLPSRAIYVVGYYRSHTRDDLFLSDEDVWLMSTYFADPSRVALLVKPRIGSGSVGGFFLWEDGRIWAEYSRAEFPFDSLALGAGEPEPEETPAGLTLGYWDLQTPLMPIQEPGQVSPGDGLVAPVTVAVELAEGVAVAEADEVAVKPIEVKASEAAVQQSEPAFPAPEEEPAALLAQGEPEAKTPGLETTPPAPEDGPAIRVPEPAIAEPTPELETAPPPSLSQTTQAAVRRGEGLSWRALLPWSPVFLMLVLLGGWLGTHSARYVGLGTPRDNSPDPYALRLAVFQYENNLHLTWDRNSPALRQAERAVVIIGDGDQTRTLELDTRQLMSGSVIYRGMGNPVRFRLELYLTGNRTVSEGWEPPPPQQVPAQP